MKRLKRPKLWLGLFIFVLVAHLLQFPMVAMVDSLLALPLRVLFGWIGFLRRVVPEIEWDGLGIAAGVISAVLLVVMVHRLSRWNLARSAAAVGGLLCTCIAGICLVGASHELVWLRATRDPVLEFNAGWPDSWQAETDARLVVIGQAVQLDETKRNKRHPSEGRMRSSWLTQLLPYVGRDDLFREIRHDLAWDHPDNHSTLSHRIPAFENPQVRFRWHERPQPLTDPVGHGYAHFASSTLLINDEGQLSLSRITDGAAHTLLAGEVHERFKPWGDPSNHRDPRLGLNTSDDGFGSRWTSSGRGVPFLFADGSVCRLSNDIDPAVLHALATPAGGERVDKSTDSSQPSSVHQGKSQ